MFSLISGGGRATRAWKVGGRVARESRNLGSSCDLVRARGKERSEGEKEGEIQRREGYI